MQGGNDITRGELDRVLRSDVELIQPEGFPGFVYVDATGAIRVDDFTYASLRERERLPEMLKAWASATPETGGLSEAPTTTQFRGLGMVDEREPITSEADLTSVPYRQVGLVDVVDWQGNTDSQGSGFLVGPRHVLTAAHVITAEGEDQPLQLLGGDPETEQRYDVFFAPGRLPGANLNGIYEARGAVYLLDWLQYPGNTQWDIALIVMNDDQNLASLGWFGMCDPDPDLVEESSVWNVTGYPSRMGFCNNSPLGNDRCEGYMYSHMGCEAEPGKIFQFNGQTRCDALPGQSGGPFWTNCSGRPCGFGVNSAGNSTTTITFLTNSRIDLFVGRICETQSAHTSYQACN